MNNDTIMKELAKLLQKEQPVKVPPNTPPGKVGDVIRSQLVPGKISIAHPSVVQYMKKQRREVNK